MTVHLPVLSPRYNDGLTGLKVDCIHLIIITRALLSAFLEGEGGLGS